MPDLSLITIAVIAVALIFDFTNGWNDAANAIATVVSTRVLSPRTAIILATLFNFLGAYLSTKVAKTVGGGIVDPAIVSEVTVLCAMLAAAIWVAILTMAGMPISGSHSLIGGLVGAAVAENGFAVLKLKGLVTILVAIFLSPIFGFILSFFLMLLIIWIFKRTAPGKVNRIFGKLQILSASFMALNHGMNDAQKVMGVVTLTLFTAGYQANLHVPFWVITICAMAMALGTAIGGWKVIKTLGMNLIKLRPVHGFAAETAASSVLVLAAGMGVPVSTTHTITASIMGIGTTDRLSAVKWGLGAKIVYAWIFTLPGCALLGGLFAIIIKLLFHS